MIYHGNARYGRPVGRLARPGREIQGTLRAVAAFAAVLLLTGCGDGGTEPEAEAVASVTVGASQTVIAIGGSTVVRAVAKAADGTTLSGRSISFASSKPGVASVDPAGTVEGLSRGTTTITATSEGKSASIDIIVASIHLDLEYGESSELQKMDLYLPEGDGSLPVVVYVHGGGFFAGDKSQTDLIEWQPLLERGFAFASVNYRLRDEALFPAFIHDVKGAIRFLRRNGDRFGLDTTRVGAWGPSAGGMLVGLLALSEQEATLRGSLHSDYGSGVDAAVLWFPWTDLYKNVQQLREMGCAADWVMGEFESFLGTTEQDVLDWASPITYVSSDAPPILMQHGTADCTVPPAQSEILRDALLEAGASDVTVHLVPGAGHGIGDLGFQAPATVQRVIDFFVRTLG